MTKGVLILLLIAICKWADGQSLITLSGRVVDSTGTGLARATVEWISRGDTINTLTADSGTFELQVTPRPYCLVVTMRGYRGYTRPAEAPPPTGHLPLIVLQHDYQELDPVVVSRVKPLTVVGDTLCYNTAAYPVRDGSDVEDILKRLPGIEVDMDGNVLVQGKKLEKILVNGKEFFGGDVLTAIRNLPADVVEKLQVIDDFGDKARLTGVKAGEPAKILNIVLQPNKRNGLFGHGQAGAGNEGKYANEVFGNDFQGDLQLSASGNAVNNSPAGNAPEVHGGASYADTWSPRLAGGLNVSTGQDKSDTRSGFYQYSYYPGETIHTQQTTVNQTTSNSLSGGGVFTFRPGLNTLLRITPSLSRQTGMASSTAAVSTAESDSSFSKISNGTTVTVSKTQSWTTGADLYFETTKPESRRRFSVGVEAHVTGRQQTTNENSNMAIETDSLASSSLVVYDISDQAQNLNIGLQGNYYLPAGAKSFFELGYTLNSSTNRDDRATRSPDSVTGAMLLVDSLSASTRYTTFSQRLHLGFIGTSAAWSWFSSVEGVPGSMSGNAGAKAGRFTYDYFSIFPHLESTWRPDRSLSITAQYNGHTQLPSLQQVSPATDLTNPQAPVSGNPDLKPAYVHDASLTFERSSLLPTQFWDLGVGIGYSLTEHPIVGVVTHPKDTGLVIQETTYLNYGTIGGWHANYHFSLPAFLKKRLRITATGILSGLSTPVISDSVRSTSRTIMWNQGLHLQLMIPSNIEADLEGSYSISHSGYSAASNLPTSTQAATVNFGMKKYFLTQWSASAKLAEVYTSGSGGLTPTPPTVTGSIQRDLFRHNKGTITLSVYNILNSGNASSQTVTPTSITKTETIYAGRYFLLSFQLRLQHFR